MIAFLSRRRLRQLETAEQLVNDLRQQSWTLSHAVLRAQAERDLIRQAKEKAEHDAAYWRERAERFLDQIALKQGIISMPTMTEPEAPAVDKLEGLFSAIGVAAINSDHSPAPGAASAAPTVTGVDPAAAQAAIDDALQDVRRLA